MQGLFLPLRSTIAVKNDENEVLPFTLSEQVPVDPHLLGTEMDGPPWDCFCGSNNLSRTSNAF
jgi:hypothetical protein